MEFNLNTLPKSLLIILLLALVVSGCSSVSYDRTAKKPVPPLFQGADLFIDTVKKNNQLSSTERDDVESIVDGLIKSLISSLIFHRHKYFIPEREEEIEKRLFLVEFNQFGVPTHIYIRTWYHSILGMETDLSTYLTSGLKIPHLYTAKCKEEKKSFTQDMLSYIQPVLVTNVPLVGGPGEDFFLATTIINRSNLPISQPYDYFGDKWVNKEIHFGKCSLDLGFSAEKALKAWGELRWIGT